MKNYESFCMWFINPLFLLKVVVHLSWKWFPHPLFSPLNTTVPKKGIEIDSVNNVNFDTEQQQQEKIKWKNKKGNRKREL